MPTDRLWTPWRMEYIKDTGRSGGCIFCDLPALDPSEDRASLIVARGERAFVILNKFPYNSGHVMVAAYRHVAEFEGLEPAEHAEIAAWTAATIEALRSCYSPEGFNIGVNQGKVAGAGIADHMHMHIVPRWSADTNYMTTVGDTKVLPETLDQTWERIRPILSPDG